MTSLDDAMGRLADDPDLGWRLQLAFAGLHPDSTRALLDTHGPEGAISRVAAAKSGNVRAAQAAAVPAATRLEELGELEISLLFRGDPDYPSQLAALPAAPDVLFVKGSWPAGPSVAVVGTRRCTAYGRNLAGAYGHAIADAGWVLVSGLARGVDGAAHRGTVAAAGRGIAVLGCGLDVAYPREHAALRDDLLAGGGAVVSEYPPGTPPEAWRFPPRNRIISGSSQAVVVVEAAVKGGALITANLALEQGVPVFATPGDVGKASAAGCNLLIRDGAHPVLDPVDLIAELELLLGPAAQPVAAAGEYPWRGVTIDQMANRRGVPIVEAAATLARAEAGGAVVRRGDRYYPTLDRGR